MRSNGLAREREGWIKARKARKYSRRGKCITWDSCYSLPWRYLVYLKGFLIAVQLGLSNRTVKPLPTDRGFYSNLVFKSES
jgi:hypothetical protein